MAVARYSCLTPFSGDGGGAPDPGGPEGKDLGLTPQVPVLVTFPLGVRIKYRIGVGLVPVTMSNVGIAPDVPLPESSTNRDGCHDPDASIPMLPIHAATRYHASAWPCGRLGLVRRRRRRHRCLAP